MINLIMKKRTFKVKSLRIETDKLTNDNILLADTWDDFNTRLVTGSFELCSLVKDEIDDSIAAGKSAHRLDIRTAYNKLRERDMRYHQPIPQDQLNVLKRAVRPAQLEELDETHLEDGIYTQDEYNKMEARLLLWLSAKPSPRNTWINVSLERLARSMNLNSDETACLDKVLMNYCERYNIQSTKTGTSLMYNLPFKGKTYEALR